MLGSIGLDMTLPPRDIHIVFKIITFVDIIHSLFTFERMKSTLLCTGIAGTRVTL